MTWTDLAADVAELFTDARVDLSAGYFVDRGFRDPHPDADHWLELAPRERARVAPVYARRLALVRKENARAFVKPKRDRAAYMRALRARNPELRARQAKTMRAWHERNPTKSAEYSRAWRERQKGR